MFLLALLAALGWLLAVVFAAAYLDMERAHRKLIRDTELWRDDFERRVTTMEKLARPGWPAYRTDDERLRARWN